MVSYIHVSIPSLVSTILCNTAPEAIQQTKDKKLSAIHGSKPSFLFSSFPFIASLQQDPSSYACNNIYSRGVINGE